jgi:hypothetical protein
MDTLTVQVWKLDFREFKSPAAKLVALAIARRARENGVSWARQSTLADDCGVSKQTIHRCLEELEAKGWMRRVPRHRSDGGRSSDFIWLTLPGMHLEGTTVDPKELRRLQDSGEFDGPTMQTPPDTVGDAAGQEGAQAAPGSPPPPDTESTLKESLKDSKKSEDAGATADGPDVPAAVNLIWARASKTGRGRSSKADIEKALMAALARGHAMERILRGLGAYFASPDATKDDGAFQRGAHVVLANDRWESFLDDEAARAGRGERTDPAAAAVTEELGTLEHPTPKRQRVWMDLDRQGMPWDSERGPRPGLLGCRVDPAIQAEYGYAAQPLAPPPASGDDSAFD